MRGEPRSGHGIALHCNPISLAPKSDALTCHRIAVTARAQPASQQDSHVALDKNSTYLLVRGTIYSRRTYIPRYIKTELSHQTCVDE